MKWIVFVAIIGILGCKSKEATKRELLEGKLRTFLLQNFKDIDSTVMLDSIRLVKLDTVGRNDCYKIMASEISDSLDYYQTVTQVNLQKVKSYQQLAKLYRGISHTLFEQNRDEGAEELQKAQNNLEIVKRLTAAQDSIVALSKTADSITPLFMEAKCFYQLRYKDASIKRDTAFVYTTPDYEILKRADFNKQVWLVK